MLVISFSLIPYSLKEKRQLKEQNRLIKKWKKTKKPKRKIKKKKSYEKLTYTQLLQLSEWRKRREQILIRDDYTCQDCGFKIHLEVHHIEYKHKYPWLSPDKDLITLCEICHTKKHSTNK